MHSFGNILTEAGRIAPEMIRIRRAIHRNPELGGREWETQAFVMGILSELSLPARAIADTGVTADIRGAHDGPVVALRADLDALPIEEQTDFGFSSENRGVMHACGHDMHTAALLGAAMLLCGHKNELRGTVRLLFQPDEENDGGAERMISDGVMDGVSAVFGMHADPDLPTGFVGVCPGPAYAASNPFDIHITGLASHGAEPHLGRDVLPAACALYQSIQTLASRLISPLSPAVITIGSLRAGTVRNVLAQEAHLQGIIRCYGEEKRAEISGHLERMTRSIAEAHRVQARVSIVHGYDGVVNDDAMTRLAEDTALSLLGPQRVGRYVPTLTTEDFGSFLRLAPGSYWHIGVSDPASPCAPLHNPRFSPDEKALPVAAALHACIALRCLH